MRKQFFINLGIILTIVAVWIGVALFTHNFDVTYGYDRLVGGILLLLFTTTGGVGLFFYFDFKD